MIRSVAVLGAGTMGAQIAAHFANAGVPALLLDLDAKIARQGFERARALRPDPFFTPDTHRLVRTAGFDALDQVAACDWIIEAVVERLDVKQSLFERIEAVVRPGTIISSNTSGLPIAALADGRSPAFRRHFLGTHFFNPPRYLRLLEVIPTPETDPVILDTVTRFADHRLGKGVVVAKDTPNFIANHVGLFGVIRMLHEVAAGRYTIEEVDELTGPALGRPKSATFRTMDIAGIDVLGHVTRNLAERTDSVEARAAFVLPPFVHEMLTRGWVGEKSGQGFYKRVKTPLGDSDILVLDPKTIEDRPRQPVRLASLEAARGLEPAGERLRTLFNARDRAGELLRRTLAPTLLYTARVTPEIAQSIDDVDRAMRWGFGWELGPFETWDVLGVAEVVRAAEPAGMILPRLVDDVLRSGHNAFRQGPLPPQDAGLEILRAAKERSRVVRRNAGASLVDLDDGVMAVEFHSKMNALGGDAIEMLMAGVAEAGKNGAALVVGNNAPNFSAGANLMLLLIEAQEGNWDEIDQMVRAFQDATMALRLADIPVIAAPAGLAIGGGCEVVLHADRVQAAAETYLGLVEVGVGLIPAGGGTKEMVVRSVEHVPRGAGLLPFIQPAFEMIGFGKVSASGPDAIRLGYLRNTDIVTFNRDRLIADAKARALARVAEGYQPPLPRTIAVGGEGVMAALHLGVHLAWKAGRLSDHDALIGRKLAWIMSGGSLPHAADVSEQYLLDLEREAFLSLCGEPKTLARIQHTLTTGKPLRN